MVKTKSVRIDRSRTFPIEVKSKTNKKLAIFERVGIVVEFVLDHNEQMEDYLILFREHEKKIREELKILELQIRGEYK